MQDTQAASPKSFSEALDRVGRASGRDDPLQACGLSRTCGSSRWLKATSPNRMLASTHDEPLSAELTKTLVSATTLIRVALCLGPRLVDQSVDVLAGQPGGNGTRSCFATARDQFVRFNRDRARSNGSEPRRANSAETSPTVVSIISPFRTSSDMAFAPESRIETRSG